MTSRCPLCGEPAREIDIEPFLDDGRFPMCSICYDATMFALNVHTMTYGKPEDEFIRALEAKTQKVLQAQEASPSNAEQDPQSKE